MNSYLQPDGTFRSTPSGLRLRPDGTFENDPGGAAGAPPLKDAVVIETSTYNLTAADSGSILKFTYVGTIEVYTDVAFPEGWNVGMFTSTLGTIHINAGAGASVIAPGSRFYSAEINGLVSLIRTADGQVLVGGDTAEGL